MQNETKVYLATIRKQILTEVVRGAIVAGFVLVGMYFTVNSNTHRIEAIENSRSELVPEFIEVKTQVANQTDDIKEIKQDVKDIKNFLLTQQAQR